MTENSDNPLPTDSSASHPSKQDPAAAPDWRILAWQLAALLSLTLLFYLFDLDRKISGYFFNPEEGFYLRNKPLWQWLYHYGTLPGVVLTISALLVWGGSFWVKRLNPWRRPCLLVVLTAVIAAGLLVNAVLKQYWGRPRPNQTTEYGGYWNYQHVFPPGPPGKGSSFPCGHCAMGFVFVSMWGFRRQSKALAIGGVITGITLGVALSATRVIQGAHFVSDTIWSLGLVMMTVTALYNGLVHRPAGRPRSRTQKRKVPTLVLTAIALFVIVTGFLTRRPYYDSNRYRLDLTPAVQKIDLMFNATPVRLNIAYVDTPDGWLQVDTRGLGWINADTRLGHQARLTNSHLTLTLAMTMRSYFDELDHTLTLTIPRALKGAVDVSLNGDQYTPRSR